MLTQSQPYQRSGQSAAGGALGAGVTTLITAGANSNGVILRTVTLGGESQYANLRVGGTPVFTCPSSQVFNYQGPGFLVPPGVAVAADGGTGGGYAHVTWDAAA